MSRRDDDIASAGMSPSGYSLGRPVRPGTPFVDLETPREAGEPPAGGSSLAKELRRARAARAKAAAASTAANQPVEDDGRRTASARARAPAKARARRHARELALLDPAAAIHGWFAEHGWAPFEFQEEMWRA
ncbi:MAG: hypothetical protein ABI637_11040, partial [Gemmatimonadota bacterium]